MTKIIVLSDEVYNDLENYRHAFVIRDHGRAVADLLTYYYGDADRSGLTDEEIFGVVA